MAFYFKYFFLYFICLFSCGWVGVFFTFILAQNKMLKRNIPLLSQQSLGFLLCSSVGWCICPPQSSHWSSPLSYHHEGL